MSTRTNTHIVTRLAVAALLSTIFAMAAAAEGKPASGYELQAFSSAPTADCQALPAASASSASSSSSASTSSAGTLCVSVSWS